MNAHDVFLSYSSKDANAAKSVCTQLEHSGIRCWVAPRDITPGSSWSAQITRAIRASGIFVLLLSEQSNVSRDVLNEVSLAAEAKLHIVNLRLANVDPSDDLHYHLRSVHWLDAWTPTLQEHVGLLVEAIQKLLSLEPDHSRAPHDGHPSNIKH